MLRKFPIKYRDVEDLLKLTEELLHCLHPNDNHRYSLKSIDEKSEKDSLEVLKKIEYYIKQEEEHYNRIKNNKFIPFPPLSK